MELRLQKIFVSRANGYLNSHIITYLLEWRLDCVLGIEESSNESEYSHLRRLFEHYHRTPEIRHVDYSSEQSVKEAIEGCDVIIHPLSTDGWYLPTDPVDCYKKPVSDALMIMHCAHEEKIDRVIMTGSLVSVYGGIDKSTIEVTDTDWGNIYNMTPQARAYLYSERAVWAFNQQLDKPRQLTVLNLGTLFGPPLSVLEKHSSMKFMLKLMNGNVQSLLPLRFPTLDVRDAALIHVMVLNKKETFDKRFNVCQGIYWMNELVEIVHDEFKFLGLQITESIVGSIPVKLASSFDSKLKEIFFQCSKDLKITSLKIKELIDLRFRSLDETLIDMGYNIIDKGQIKKEIDLIKPFTRSSKSQSDSP